VGEEKDNPQLFYDVNVGGTGNTWRAAHAAGVKHAVLISSVAVYGRPDVPEVDETAPIRPNDVAYEKTKAGGEDVALSVGRLLGLRTVILRPSLIWGPYDEQFVPRIQGALKSGRFAFVGDPSRTMNVCHSGHIVACAQAALERTDVNQEAFNVVDGELPSWRDAVALVAREAGLPVPTHVIPKPLALALGTALDAVRKLGIPVNIPFTRFTAHVAGARCVYRVDKARRQLGFVPTHVFLRDGVPFIRAALR
jgi:nucleoside-diphosphate-sugar epimerase